MRKIISFILFLFFIGCSDDPPEREYSTIMELVESDEFQQAKGADVTVALDSLAKLLHYYPELVDKLSGPSEQPHTLFAPSNQAFIDWINTFSLYGNIADIREDILKGIIYYHVVEGTYEKEEICEWGVDGHETLLSCNSTGSKIRLNSNCTISNCHPNKLKAVFKDENRKTLNGNVHVIESVLLPNSCLIVEVDGLLGIIQDYNYPGMMFQTEYSYFAQAMTLVNCGVSGVDGAFSILASSGPMTFFLPTNAAFEEAAFNQGKTISQLIASYSASQWSDIILNHIVIDDAYSFAELTNSFELITIQHDACRLIVTDVPVTAQTPLGKVLSTSGCNTGINEGAGASGVPILTSNLNARNGVCHTVGKILFPN